VVFFLPLSRFKLIEVTNWFSGTNFSLHFLFPTAPRSLAGCFQIAPVLLSLFLLVWENVPKLRRRKTLTFIPHFLVMAFNGPPSQSPRFPLSGAQGLLNQIPLPLSPRVLAVLGVFPSSGCYCLQDVAWAPKVGCSFGPLPAFPHLGEVILVECHRPSYIPGSSPVDRKCFLIVPNSTVKLKRNAGSCPYFPLYFFPSFFGWKGLTL